MVNLCYTTAMGQLDKVKEILNTLRVTMSIMFGLLVVLIGALLKRYDTQTLDNMFWIGAVIAMLIILVIFAIIKKIAKKTSEIGEL